MTAIKNEKFKIAASHTIGACILPGELMDNIHQQVDQRITLKIASCNAIVKAVKARKVDIGFIEFEVKDHALNCTPWMNDELVFCSKKALAETLTVNTLKNYSLLCGKAKSVDRNALDMLLLKQDVHLSDFDSIQEVDNPTAIIQNLKWSNPHANITPIALVSKQAIEYELKHKHFYLTSISKAKILKKFYVLYRNDAEYIDQINAICQRVLKLKLI